MKKIYILTSTDGGDPDPALISYKWHFRYYQEAAIGLVGNITLQADRLARHVAVYSSYNQGVTLKEVRVFAHSEETHILQGA